MGLTFRDRPINEFMLIRGYNLETKNYESLYAIVINLPLGTVATDLEALFPTALKVFVHPEMPGSKRNFARLRFSNAIEVEQAVYSSTTFEIHGWSPISSSLHGIASNRAALFAMRYRAIVPATGRPRRYYQHASSRFCGESRLFPR